MRILKPGKVEQRKFTCSQCGCEFVAVLREADPCGWVECPEDECSSGCSWECGEPYEEPTPTQTSRDRLADLICGSVTTDYDTATDLARELIANGVTFKEVTSKGNKKTTHDHYCGEKGE